MRLTKVNLDCMLQIDLFTHTFYQRCEGTIGSGISGERPEDIYRDGTTARVLLPPDLQNGYSIKPMEFKKRDLG